MNLSLFWATLLAGTVFIACKSNPDQRATMHQTSDSIAIALKAGDVQKFKSYFYTNDLSKMTKDEGIVANDVKIFSQFHKAYFADKHPTPVYTDLYNSVGQYVVKIPIYNRPDSTGIVNEMHINLYFGPLPVSSTDKITGYELIRNNRDSGLLKPHSDWQKK